MSSLPRGISSDPSVADGDFRRVALDHIGSHKKDFVKVAAIRVGRTFSVYDPFHQRELEAERGTPMWVLTAALWSYWLLAPLAVGGAIEARRRRVPIYPLMALVVLSVLMVIPTIGAVRYRSLAEVALVVFAAVGIDSLVRAAQQRRTPETVIWLDEPLPTTESVSDASSPQEVPTRR